MKMDKKQSFKGRPTVAPKPGERGTVSLRLTAETKDRIDKAAKANGRPFSQEAELRIEKSFEREGLLPDALELSHGREAAGLIFALGLLMTVGGRAAAYEKAITTKKPVQPWATDPYAYDQAVRSVVALLELARPGKPDFSIRPDVDEGRPKDYANDLVRAVKGTAQGAWANGVFGAENIDTIRKLLGQQSERLQDDPAYGQTSNPHGESDGDRS
jgi:hypothetical protein